jgi:protein-tyrosine-phosphatase
MTTYARVPHMTTAPVNEPRALRVLFLCTGNSARSQMAEALLNHKGNGRFHAASAGSRPAARVHPYAIAALRQAGIVWAGHEPRTLDGAEYEPWDIVITVCDRAKESCPYLPGQPILAHWGMEDPAEADGPDAAKVRAFEVALLTLARRIDLLVALPIESLDRPGMHGRVRAIGAELSNPARQPDKSG